VLLLDLRLGGRAAARCRGGRRDRDRGLDVEGLLELLDEVRQFKEGHLPERVEQVVVAELGHGGHSSVWSWSAAAASATGSSFGISVGVWPVLAGPVPACPVAPSASASRFAWSAPASLAIWTGSAASVAAAFAIDAFTAPANIASSTSRDSSSASLSISAGLIDLPSITPPLITRAGLALAKSRSPLAASTTSPLTKAIAEGPLTSPSTCAAMPASAAASLVRVFFTTRNVACSPSEWRSSASWATVRPRYSASTAPLELWNRSVSSATAATFSALAMGLLSWAGRPLPGQGHQPRPASARASKTKRPGAWHQGVGAATPREGRAAIQLGRLRGPPAMCGSFGHPMPGMRRQPTVFG